jgi:hypothetical protein
VSMGDEITWPKVVTEFGSIAAAYDAAYKFLVYDSAVPPYTADEWLEICNGCLRLDRLQIAHWRAESRRT